MALRDHSVSMRKRHVGCVDATGERLDCLGLSEPVLLRTAMCSDSGSVSTSRIAMILSAEAGH